MPREWHGLREPHLSVGTFGSKTHASTFTYLFLTEDNVMMEARNLHNMTIAQTPLLGDENTPIHVGPGGGTGFEGATPRH
jgi:hypothetical protein